MKTKLKKQKIQDGYAFFYRGQKIFEVYKNCGKWETLIRGRVVFFNTLKTAIKEHTESATFAYAIKTRDFDIDVLGI